MIFYIFTGVIYLNNNYINNKLIFIFCLSGITVQAAPTTIQFISRAYADIDVDLKPYRRSRTWLLPANQDEANKVMHLNKDIIQSLPIVKHHVPYNECLYALQGPIVMLYANRITGIFPKSDISDKKFAADTQSCRFFLAMPLSNPKKTYPSYYPLQRIKDESKYEIIPIFNPYTENKNASLILIKRLY